MGDGYDLDQYLRPPASQHTANALRTRRDTILQNWIQRVGQEPFHLGRMDRAVADHIPRLLDALIEYVAAFGEGGAEVGPADSELHKIAGEHALSRLTQGLSTSEVISEIRILGQEIGAELRASSTDVSLAGSDQLGAELVINDVLFGAVIVASEILGEAFRRQRNDAADLVVHDLRTPLTSIKGFAELLRRSPENERVSQAASTILEQTSRLTALIDGFLVGTALCGMQFRVKRRPHLRRALPLACRQ